MKREPVIDQHLVTRFGDTAVREDDGDGRRGEVFAITGASGAANRPCYERCVAALCRPYCVGHDSAH